MWWKVEWETQEATIKQSLIKKSKRNIFGIQIKTKDTKYQVDTEDSKGLVVEQK
jgi:hypothetical protein